MKKLADMLDKNGKSTNVGDYVFFKIWREHKPFLMLGKIKRIDGAYVYVESALDKQDVWELYTTELEKANKRKIVLWIFENK
jgi:hypothetical protein